MAATSSTSTKVVGQILPILVARAAGEEYTTHHLIRTQSIIVHWNEVWQIASENMFPFLVMIDTWKWNATDVPEYQVVRHRVIATMSSNTTSALGPHATAD